MNEFVVANRATDWLRLKSLVLDSGSSAITRRVYNLGLEEFIAWFTATNEGDVAARDANIHRLVPVTRNAKSSRLRRRSRRKSADNSVLSRRCHNLAGVLLISRTPGRPALSRASLDQSNQSA